MLALVLLCIVPLLVAVALAATTPRSGGLIDGSFLSLTLRGSRYLQVKPHLVPGLHVASSWKDWVDNWAAVPPSSRVTVQTFKPVQVVDRSVTSGRIFPVG